MLLHAYRLMPAWPRFCVFQLAVMCDSKYLVYSYAGKCCLYGGHPPILGCVDTGVLSFFCNIYAMVSWFSSKYSKHFVCVNRRVKGVVPIS